LRRMPAAPRSLKTPAQTFFAEYGCRRAVKALRDVVFAGIYATSRYEMRTPEFFGESMRRVVIAEERLPAALRVACRPAAGVVHAEV